jgi:hypothetical protein
VLSVAVEGKEVLSPHIWMGFRLGSFAPTGNRSSS